MSGIHVVTEGETPRGTLKDMLDRVDEFDAVIVLAIAKDGSQYATSSRMNMHEKCFLHAFFGTWITKWFVEGIG